jgi:hypothetical protein
LKSDQYSVILSGLMKQNIIILYQQRKETEQDDNRMGG